jgi:hypothetical protein
MSQVIARRYFVILSNPEVLIQSLLCRIPLSFILGFYVSQVISRWW